MNNKIRRSSKNKIRKRKTIKNKTIKNKTRKRKTRKIKNKKRRTINRKTKKRINKKNKKSGSSKPNMDEKLWKEYRYHTDELDQIDEKRQNMKEMLERRRVLRREGSPNDKEYAQLADLLDKQIDKNMELEEKLRICLDSHSHKRLGNLKSPIFSSDSISLVGRVSEGVPPDIDFLSPLARTQPPRRRLLTTDEGIEIEPDPEPEPEPESQSEL